MIKNLIRISLVISILGINFCYGMERQDKPGHNKKSKSYIVRSKKEKKEEAKSWRQSLPFIFNRDKAQVDTKFDQPVSRDSRRSFSLVFAKAPKSKHSSVGNASVSADSLVPKTPQTSIHFEEEFLQKQELLQQDDSLSQEEKMPHALALLALSRQAGVTSRSTSPTEAEFNLLQLQEMSATAKKSHPSLTTAQIMLGRKATLLREKYAKDRSGRDSQVKITAKEYLGRYGEAALVVDPSPSQSPRTDETASPRTDETVTPRTEQGTPRTEDSTTPREELETPRIDVFASPRADETIVLNGGDSSNN